MDAMIEAAMISCHGVYEFDSRRNIPTVTVALESELARTSGIRNTCQDVKKTIANDVKIAGLTEGKTIR
ncbi:MAG: hypothetical protein ACRD4Q_08155, partial [Candidatus Acidiferrales bacterium]